MDKFDLKKYLTEGKILKENTTKYEPFEKGETFLRRSELFDGRYDYSFDIETEEQYEYLIKNGVGAFLSKYEDEDDPYLGSGFDLENLETYRSNEREEYSVGNDMNSYSLTPINENKSTNQIKEDTTKYEPFVKGETFLRRTEFIDLKREHLHFLDSKEEYDYLVENGAIGYLNKYLPEGVDILVDSPEKMYKEEYSLGNDEFDDGLPIVSENKSTTQLKEYKIK